jgi:hypothetical protein
MDDLQTGKAGEYLVCADLILRGLIAFPSEQGLPFDVVALIEDDLYKIQVKTTRQPQPVPQRKNRTDKYLFHVRRCGKGGRRSYLKNEVDIFALVALDTKTIGYIKASEAKQTMFFLPENAEPIKVKHGAQSKVKKLSEYDLPLCLI